MQRKHGVDQVAPWNEPAELILGPVEHSVPPEVIASLIPAGINGSVRRKEIEEDKALKTIGVCQGCGGRTRDRIRGSDGPRMHVLAECQECKCSEDVWR